MKKIVFSILLISLSLFNKNGNAQNADTTKHSTHPIFTFVEQMPIFSGKPDDINNFIADNLVYPQVAKDSGIEGRVVVQFVVNIDGSLSDFKIIRDIGYGCGDAAINVLKKTKMWIPGKQNGKPVPVYYTLPIQFSLQ